MNWKDAFNRPMELETPEYRLAVALKELKRRVDAQEITEQEALEVMDPLIKARVVKLQEDIEGSEIGNG